MNEPEPDLGLCFTTTPPLIIPLSDRAKQIIDLPEGVDCAIFLDAPDKLLALFEDDYLILAMNDYQPSLIKPCSLELFYKH